MVEVAMRFNQENLSRVSNHVQYRMLEELTLCVFGTTFASSEAVACPTVNINNLTIYDTRQLRLTFPTKDPPTTMIFLSVLAIFVY